ncbi:MAG: LEA type 2 family protein [Chromatiales bacterium]|nr:LEA type 2 family protein [Chromatiales bacterium]
MTIGCRTLIALLLIIWLSGCATLPQPTEPPRVTLSSLRIIDAQLFEQRYALTLRVQNPNSVDLNITGLSFTVELNGNGFAEGVSKQAANIPAFGEATIEVEVTSSLLQIFEQFKALNERQERPLEYRIHGKIGTAHSLLSLPFERKGEIAFSSRP